MDKNLLDYIRTVQKSDVESDLEEARHQKEINDIINVSEDKHKIEELELKIKELEDENKSLKKKLINQ